MPKFNKQKQITLKSHRTNEKTVLQYATVTRYTAMASDANNNKIIVIEFIFVIETDMRKRKRQTQNGLLVTEKLTEKDETNGLRQNDRCVHAI